MKLTYQIIFRISIALLILMAVWSGFFYYIIIDEINDETDDSLEAYSEFIITRALAGESLPDRDNGTNNSYYISEVSEKYANLHPGISYSDEMIYIHSLKETEPARILRTIFKDANNHYYELTVAIPTIEKDDLQETILWWIIILYVILLLAIIVINIWVLYKSLRPLYTLLGWLDEFTVGKELPPLNNDTKVTEFRKLNEAILRSGKRNREVYEQQKLFIGHASHELQTPLAICGNRLEILSNDPDLTEKQLEEIMKTRQTLDHIVKLNKTLLLLTKIDNNQFPERSEININDLLKKLIDDYSEVYAYRGIEVNYIENDTLTFKMNDVLASILFSNLLKNAYNHNRNNGKIMITVNSAQVQFSNTGNDRALNADEIFKRFYQGSKKEGSTGLGLALVESISKLYNIHISYNFFEGDHLFTLKITQ